MDDVKQFDIKAARRLKACRSRLSKQQYATLKGQIIAGDSDGAMRGLQKILERRNIKEGANFDN